MRGKNWVQKNLALDIYCPKKSNVQKNLFEVQIVLDWNQGLTKLEFDTEDQVLFSILIH